MAEYIPPQHNLDGFHCSHCGVLSQHHWSGKQVSGTTVSWAVCTHCQEVSVWVKEKLYYPSATVAPLPHPDMPENVRERYSEARGVFPNSPRSSAALLRLSIEELVDHLEAEGDNLFAKIGNLKQKGMPEGIVKALDVVRVIGNDAVHPGQIDFNDTLDTTLRLFRLVNVIVENQISIPSEVEELYSDSLSEGQIDSIEQRDSNG